MELTIMLFVSTKESTMKLVINKYGESLVVNEKEYGMLHRLGEAICLQVESINMKAHWVEDAIFTVLDREGGYIQLTKKGKRKISLESQQQ